MECRRSVGELNYIGSYLLVQLIGLFIIRLTYSIDKNEARRIINVAE
jgi:hypothetical protein